MDGSITLLSPENYLFLYLSKYFFKSCGVVCVAIHIVNRHINLYHSTLDSFPIAIRNVYQIPKYSERYIPYTTVSNTTLVDEPRLNTYTRRN